MRIHSLLKIVQNKRTCLDQLSCWMFFMWLSCPCWAILMTHWWWWCCSCSCPAGVGPVISVNPAPRCSSQEVLMRKHGRTLIHVQSTHTCTRRHSHSSLGLTVSLSPVHSAAVSAPCPTTHKTCTGRRLLRQSSVFWHVLWWEKSRGRCGGREPPLTYRWRESTLLYIILQSCKYCCLSFYR